MTSRERVKMAINHKEVDRVPIDLGAMRSTGIATIAYNELRKKLGITKGLVKMYDFVQQLAYPEKEIMDMFHSLKLPMNMGNVSLRAAFLWEKRAKPSG